LLHKATSSVRLLQFSQVFTCKSPQNVSGPDETRTRGLRHARAERRFRRRSLSFEKPLKQAESSNRLTTDVRHCSRRLSSNCRQLHKQMQGIKGNLIHRSASLFDSRTCCAGGLRARGSGKDVGQVTRLVLCRILQTDFRGFPFRDCLENSLGRLRAPFRRQHAPESELLRALLSAP
jgi:hypothetical protein